MSKRQKTKKGRGRKPKAANKTKSKAKGRKQLKKLLPPVLRSPTSQLGKCLEDFIKASANPFISEPACLPHSPALESSKRKYGAKGTVVVGENGFGYVVATTQLANDAISGTGYTRGWYASLATYTGTALPGDMSVGSADLVGESSGCYPTGLTTANLVSGDIQGRPVALGIRVRYIGPEQTRSGRLVCFEHPMHGPIDSYDIANCFQYGFVESVPNERQWVTALWQHKVPQEADYSDHTVPVPNLCIIIDGAKDDKYEFEISYHVETIREGYFGQSNQDGTQTPTFVDDGLFSVVNTLMSKTLTTAQDAFSYLSQSELSTYAAQLLRIAYQSTRVYTGSRQLLLQ